MWPTLVRQKWQENSIEFESFGRVVCTVEETWAVRPPLEVTMEPRCLVCKTLCHRGFMFTCSEQNSDRSGSGQFGSL